MHCIIPQTAWSDAAKLRQRTEAGLSHMEKNRYSSVKEIVRLEIKQKEYMSALSKVRWHQQQNPTDPEGFFLEGRILELLNSPENALIAYKKSYKIHERRELKKKIAKLEELIQQQRNEINDTANELFPEDGLSLHFFQQSATKSALNQTSPLEAELVNHSSAASTITGNKPHQEIKALADLNTLAKMRALDSMLSLYQAQTGSLDHFSLTSLKKEKILTLEIDFSELGELSIKDGKVYSSTFGSSADIDRALDFFRTAVKEEQAGNTDKAIEMLWENRSALGDSCLDYLLSLCEKQNIDQKIISLKQELTKRRPHDFLNIRDIAMHYYQNNQRKKALQWFRQLADFPNPHQQEAKGYIDELKQGGSWHLKQKFLRQKELLFQED